MAQSTVYVKTAPAVPGQMILGNQDDFSAVSYKTAAALKVGRFCFAASDATKVTNAGTVVIGIVPFVLAYTRAVLGATDEVPANQPITPFTGGAIAVKNEGETAAAVGMKVYADQTDGHAIFASSAPESGASATNFTVVKVYDGGVTGAIVIISNQTPTA